MEMLARAALGQFNVGSCRSDDSCPSLLHSIIELGCPPELVWHSAAKYPHEVEKLDKSGKSPLFIAGEKMSDLLRLRRERIAVSDFIPQQEAADGESGLADSDGSEASETAAAKNSFRSLFLENDNQVNLDELIANALSSQLEGEPPNVTEEATRGKVNADILMYQEIIDMLIKSRVFGKPAMASIPDNSGRLPIHLLLEAGGLWISHRSDDESNTIDTARQDPHIIDTLIDANPQALLIRDYETGLFPFMIAATSNTEGANESKKELETIFRLLLESTEVMSYCIM